MWFSLWLSCVGGARLPRDGSARVALPCSYTTATAALAVSGGPIAIALRRFDLYLLEITPATVGEVDDPPHQHLITYNQIQPHGSRQLKYTTLVITSCGKLEELASPAAYSTPNTLRYHNRQTNCKSRLWSGRLQGQWFGAYLTVGNVRCTSACSSVRLPPALNARRSPQC
jgi:hypothetical protein